MWISATLLVVMIAANNIFAKEPVTASSCGPIYHSSTTGTLQSPNYPRDYPNNAYCEWRINKGSGLEIRLTFEDFHVEGYSPCPDYVEVYHEYDTLEGRYCGNAEPPDVTSNSSFVTIIFYSDRYRPYYSGFLLRWTIVRTCPSDTLDPSDLRGTFSSPSYPSSAPPWEDCFLTISSGTAQVISITFDWFELEYDYKCSEEYVKVYDSTTLLGTFCGNDLPPNITSASSLIEIKFKSGSSDSTKGFHGAYKIVEACPSEILDYDGFRGTFSSPSYPSSAPPWEDCYITISADPGQVVSITFDYFELEFANNCLEEYVKVYDSTTLLGTFCGSDIPPTLTSASNLIEIKFKSGSSDSTKGFHGAYKIETSCGPTNLTSTTGTLQSPNYPRDYPNNVFCEWQIQGEYGSKFHLTFEDFNIELGVEDHCHDYVEIYHGDYWREGRYCGNEMPPDVISDYYSFVKVKFSSDHVVTRSGFKLKWTISDSGGGLSAGAIAGIVIACIFGSAVIVFIVWKCNNNKSVAPDR